MLSSIKILPEAPSVSTYDKNLGKTLACFLPGVGVGGKAKHKPCEIYLEPCHSQRLSPLEKGIPLYLGPSSLPVLPEGKTTITNTNRCQMLKEIDWKP